MADRSEAFYGAFGLARGTTWQLLGPQVWAAALRSALKGNGVGRMVGNPWIMPGAFLVQGDRILWQHIARHAGDQPDYRQVLGSSSEDV